MSGNAMSAGPKSLGPQPSFLRPSPAPRGARALALQVLLTIERTAGHLDDVTNRLFRRTTLDRRDRALAMELTSGVLRQRGMLDWRLDFISERPVHRLPLLVQMILRLGAYQLLCLDKIPVSAAVNESVLLAKSSGTRLGRDWSGFVNAVLRALLHNPAPAWPSPEEHPVRALSVRYSCPAWLVTRWLNRMGYSMAERLCEATSQIPPMTFRTSSLRITRDALLHQLRGAGLQARETSVSPVGVQIEKCGPVTELPGFKEGDMYIEDEAAQLIPLLLEPQPGERVLDACAAPGGKTTHLATLMQNKGEIVALDPNPQRLRLVNENCNRLGISIVQTFVGDARQFAPATGTPLFDRILLDAPCSGLGVLRRHPEGKWHKQAESLPSHHQLQYELLTAVSRYLRPGGLLVYSTCSTEPEENEQVIERFCQTHAEFVRDPLAPWLPPAGLSLLTNHGDFSTVGNLQSMDAFYAARLRRRGP